MSPDAIDPKFEYNILHEHFISQLPNSYVSRFILQSVFIFRKVLLLYIKCNNNIFALRNLPDPMLKANNKI